MRPGAIDRQFLLITLLLVVCGFLIFSSASLGLLSREGARFSSVAISQLGFGIGIGAVGLLVALRIPFVFWQKISPWLFGAALCATVLVFVPGLGFEHGGARRWVVLAGVSFQPSEFLKIAAVLFYGALLVRFHASLRELSHGLLPFVAVLALSGLVLLIQPDTGTFLVLASALGVMYFIAGASVRHLLLLGMVFALLAVALVFSRPYLMERMLTFMDPSRDPQGAGYQLKQSLIAVGSGGAFGRGFGQSVQKFSYLPEPTGDSIFSVAAEEFGFAGMCALLGLYLWFITRGYIIARRARHRFGALIVSGLVTLIGVQSFVNMGAMLGLMPLTGVPLVFISHGGTALAFALFSVGIILNVSRYSVSKKRV